VNRRPDQIGYVKVIPDCDRDNGVANDGGYGTDADSKAKIEWTQETAIWIIYVKNTTVTAEIIFDLDQKMTIIQHME
jgi:hypothetical protein